MKIKYIIGMLILSAGLLSGQGKWGAGAYGGVFMPITEFSDFYNTGFGGNVQVTYSWSENTLFTFSVGTSSWDFNSEAFNRELENSGFPQIKVDLDGTFRVVPYLLGIRWYAFRGNYRPYILLEGGLYYYETKYQGTITNSDEQPPDNIQQVPETSITGNESALALGAGTFIKLNDHLYLDAVLKYNAITNARAISDYDNDQTLTGLSRTVQYITLLAGINYRF
jgi:opacity protein-like surface antigen